MSIKTLINFILKNPISLMVRMNRTTKEFYRAGFLSTAISEGIFDVLATGPAGTADIQKAIGANADPDALEAWLDLGVALGELAKSGGNYRIKSSFAKALLRPGNDTWKAFLQARVEIFYSYIINTPAYLKENKKFDFSRSYGELFARSSRTVEPILTGVVDRIIPPNGSCRLLEAGCGSGVYIKRACDRNPDITVVGLDLQRDVIDFARANALKWKIADRATFEQVDIRDYKTQLRFNIITFFNLIYYFPLGERIDLLQHTGSLLTSGGTLVLTTLCQSNDPSIQLMNLWASMTEGCGVLPSPDQMVDQLRQAGFDAVNFEKLIPGFYLFSAQKN